MHTTADRAFRIMVYRVVLIFAAVLVLISACTLARAHWTGPTSAGAPGKAWWNSLHASGSNVPCCDIADGLKVEDVDWDTINLASADKPDVRYRVRLNGQWIVVRPEAVVTVPNRFGPAVVWPYTIGDKTLVRCFMPG